MSVNEYGMYETTTSTLQCSQAAATELVQSQRKRTLTEKGKAYITDTFFRHLAPLDKTLDKVNMLLNDYVSELELMEIGITIEKDFQQLVSLHDSLRDESEPDSNIVRAMDRLAVKKEETMSRVKRRMAAHSTGSVKSVKSLQDQVSIRDEGLSVKSRSSTSSKIKESQALLAAHTAELEAAKEMAQREEELERLELEEAKRRAEADAEIKKRKRDLEQQAIKRRLEAEGAKVEAYKEIERSEKGSVASLPVSGSGKSQLSGDMQALANAISASVRFSRIPTVEPPIFTGDPLTYHDWKMSFQTLVDNKGLKDEEKIHYLKRYLAGPALQAVSGLFPVKGQSCLPKG